MLKISQKIKILLLLTFFQCMLANVLTEHVPQAEDQGISDTILTAAIDDINDEEVFRQYNTRPYYYPYLQQQQQHQQQEQPDRPPTQPSAANDNLLVYQQGPIDSMLNNWDDPRYFYPTDENKRATVEAVESSMLPDQKFDTIVAYLLEKLEREDQQIIDGIYEMIFDRDQNTRPLETTTTVEPPKPTHQSKCYVCKKNLTQQNQQKN